MKSLRGIVVMSVLLCLPFAALADGPFNEIRLVDSGIKMIRTEESGFRWINLIGDHYSARVSYPITGTSPSVQFGLGWATITAAEGAKLVPDPG